MPANAAVQPETTYLSTALAYAHAGWAVFPLHSPGRTTYCDCGDEACPSPAKHPWTRNGLKDATLDRTQIERWWSKSWTHANIGVACGPSRLVVLDVDPRHGGMEALVELVKRHSGAEPGHYTPAMEELAATLMSETGGGGQHYVYRVPDGVSIRNATDLDGLRGLDVRGEGGYFVAPPSMHLSGARYLWCEGDMTPSAIPDWLVPVLTRKSSRPLTQPVRMFTPPRDVAEAGAYWLDRALRLAHEGNRNDRGFWLACQLRDSGLPQDAAEGVLEEYAARVPGVDYSTREASNSVRSAYRTAPREGARSATSVITSTASTTAMAATPGRHETLGTDGAPDGRQGDDSGRAEPTRPRFHFLTDEELENLPPPAWLVDGLLVQGQRSMIFGEPGSYKSFLALDLALCIATGKPWHGHETHAGRVVYIAGEGKAGIGKRIKAWKLFHGYQGSAPISVLGEAAQLLRGGDVTALIEAIQGLPDAPVAIVFDTLARAIVGGDENSAQDMGTVIAAVDALHEATGAHILLIHHKARGAKNARGSTAVPGGMDTMIDLSRDGQSITMRCDKQKEAAEFPDLQLRFEITLHSENLLESSGVLVPTGARPRLTLPLSAQQALSILRKAGSLEWTPWRDTFVAETGQAVSTYSNAIRTLEADELVHRQNGVYRPTNKGQRWSPEASYGA